MIRYRGVSFYLSLILRREWNLSPVVADRAVPHRLDHVRSSFILLLFLQIAFNADQRLHVGVVLLLFFHYVAPRVPSSTALRVDLLLSGHVSWNQRAHLVLAPPIERLFHWLHQTILYLICFVSILLMLVENVQARHQLAAEIHRLQIIQLDGLRISRVVLGLIYSQVTLANLSRRHQQRLLIAFSSSRLPELFKVFKWSMVA